MNTETYTEANVAALVAMNWISTERMALMALSWNTYPVNPYASVSPIHKMISSDEQSARDFYASIDDQDELRFMAADALAAGGWTPGRIGYKLS